MVVIHAISGPLNLSAEEYFIERDGAEFRQFFARTLKLGELVFADPELADDSQCTIPLITRPDIAAWVPASVRKHVTNAAEIEFIDELKYERGALLRPPYSISISTSSPFLGDRLKIEATMRITPIDDSSCVHSYEGTITCRMFGFGSLVERMVRDSVMQTYKKLDGIINAWEVEKREKIAEFGPGILIEGRPVGIDCGVEWIQDYLEHIVIRGEKPLRTPEVELFNELPSAISGAVSLALASQEAQKRTNRLRAALYHAWIGWIDLIKLLFVVVVVLLLRLRIVRVTHSSRSAIGQGHRRRKSWDQFVGSAVSAHRRKSSGISDSEELITRTHRRNRL